MAKTQQLITMDEINAADIEGLWINAIVKDIRPEQFPSEITCVRAGDETNVTTIWSKGRPIAIAIRQRDVMNHTVLTTIEVGSQPNG